MKWLSTIACAMCCAWLVMQSATAPGVDAETPVIVRATTLPAEQTPPERRFGPEAWEVHIARSTSQPNMVLFTGTFTGRAKVTDARPREVEFTPWRVRHIVSVKGSEQAGQRSYDVSFDMTGSGGASNSLEGAWHAARHNFLFWVREYIELNIVGKVVNMQVDEERLGRRVEIHWE